MWDQQDTVTAHVWAIAIGGLGHSFTHSRHRIYFLPVFETAHEGSTTQIKKGKMRREHGSEIAE